MNTGPFNCRLRSHLGSCLLTLALMLALVAYSGLVVRGIVVDGDVAERAAETALSDERVRAALVESAVEALDAQYLGSPLRLLDNGGHVAALDFDQIAAALVNDPRFTDALSASARAIHDYVLVDRRVAPAIDATWLTGAARAAAVAQQPRLDEVLPSAAMLRIELPAEALPDLTGPFTWLARWSKVAALAAVGLTAASFAVHGRRPLVFRRLGTWAVAVAVVQGGTALMLPWATRWLPTEFEPAALAFASTLSPRLLVPAVMLAAMGVALVVGAWRWGRTIDRTHERYGASVFLASDDAAATPWSGQIETATLRSPMGAPPVPLVSPVRDAMPTTHRGA